MNYKGQNESLLGRVDKLLLLPLTDYERELARGVREKIVLSRGLAAEIHKLSLSPVESSDNYESFLREEAKYEKLASTHLYLVIAVEKSIEARTSFKRFLYFLSGMILILLLNGFIYTGEFIKSGGFDGLFAIIYELSLYSLGKLLILILFSGLGYLLFRFRAKQRVYYGILETSFAMVSVYFVIDNLKQEHDLKHSLTSYLLLAGMSSLYLLVRGFTNIAEGWEKPFAIRGWLLNQSIQLFGKQEIEEA